MANIVSLVKSGAVRLDPGFAILIVIAGRGLLCSERGDIPLSRGMTVLVPSDARRALAFLPMRAEGGVPARTERT